MCDLPYSKPFMAEEDGTNSPLDHQRVISKLTVGLGILFYREKTIALEPLPETPLAEGPGHSVPDVILLDPETEETRIIIKVSRGAGRKTTSGKSFNSLTTTSTASSKDSSITTAPATGCATEKAKAELLLKHRSPTYWGLIWGSSCK